MTTTPNDPTTALLGRPPVVDLATWQAARDELLVREKAHTREGDAIAAARRRLPMVELDGTVEVVGPDGPVPFLDLFQGRDELVVYKHMWYDGAPHQGQCEGCTTTAWHLKDAVYLNARGVSFAILTTGRWDEVASYVEFMGYTQPWYSVRGVEAPRSSMEKVCVPPGAEGNRPSFSLSMLVLSFAFTTSAPSTVRTWAPRARLTEGAVAGEFGSVYAATTCRGGREEMITHCTP